MSLRNIRNQVQLWSISNFGNQDAINPLFGMIEEIGELCHAHLKGKQGIRHTPEEIIQLKKDAVGDILIYLFDFMGRAKLDHDTELVNLHREDIPTNIDIALARAAISATDVLFLYLDGSTEDVMHKAFDHLWTFLSSYCSFSNFDINQIVEDTWNHVVSKRDWTSEKQS